MYLPKYICIIIFDILDFSSKSRKYLLTCSMHFIHTYFYIRHIKKMYFKPKSREPFKLSYNCQTLLHPHHDCYYYASWNESYEFCSLSLWFHNMVVHSTYQSLKKSKFLYQVDDVIEKNKINVTLRGTGQHKSLFLYLIISRTLRRQKGTKIALSWCLAQRWRFVWGGSTKNPTKTITFFSQRRSESWGRTRCLKNSCSYVFQKSVQLT